MVSLVIALVGHNTNTADGTQTHPDFILWGIWNLCLCSVANTSVYHAQNSRETQDQIYVGSSVTLPPERGQHGKFHPHSPKLWNVYIAQATTFGKSDSRREGFSVKKAKS